VNRESKYLLLRHAFAHCHCSRVEFKTDARNGRPRREAEAIIMPGLPALVSECRPRGNDERLALLGACQFQGLYAAAAGMYADPFAADERLAAEPCDQCARRAIREDLPRGPCRGPEHGAGPSRTPASVAPGATC
jgi:hypothetical protein